MSLWFVVPAHRRFDLARICFTELRWACDQIGDATAVIVSDDENLEIADDLGFSTVESKNDLLGRRINDGYEFAGRNGADFFAALGNDDWVDPKWVAGFHMPEANQVRCSRLTAVVSEDGSRIAPLRVPYRGGDGIRFFPRPMMEKVGFRPAEDHRPRAIDTSIFRKIGQALGGNPSLVYKDLHPLQVVDFKSDNDQLTTYRACCEYLHGRENTTPFAALADHYPAEIVGQVASYYTGVPV